MANDFLYKEYELSYEQLRYYDDRHSSIMKYLFTITTSVTTVQLGIYEFTKGLTQGFYAFQALLSGVVFIATVLLFLAILRNRLYFVYMARQINAIRKYLMENEASEFRHNQLYTSTALGAFKLFSLHTIQMIGAAILSSLFAGALMFSIGPASGRHSSWIATILVFVSVLIVEIVSGSLYLSSTKGKSADAAIHGNR